MMRDFFKKMRLAESEKLECGKDEDDGSDDWLKGGVGNLLHEGPADDDPGYGGRQEPPDISPAGVLAEGDDGEDVPDDEHGEDDAGGIAGTKEKNEDEDVDETNSGKSALGHTDSESGDDG